MRYSMCFIKPEAMKQRFEIYKMLRAGGLQVTSYVIKAMPEWALDEFYQDSFGGNEALRKAILYHMRLQECNFLSLRANNIVEILPRVCGLSTNPNECEEGTVRARFSNKVPKIINEKTLYWHNAIHRPKNEAETAKDVGILERIISSA